MVYPSATPGNPGVIPDGCCWVLLMAVDTRLPLVEAALVGESCDAMLAASDSRTCARFDEFSTAHETGA